MWDESASWAEPAGAVTTATWVKLPFVDSRRSMCLPTHVGLLSTAPRDTATDARLIWRCGSGWKALAMAPYSPPEMRSSGVVRL